MVSRVYIKEKKTFVSIVKKTFGNVKERNDSFLIPYKNKVLCIAFKTPYWCHLSSCSVLMTFVDKEKCEVKIENYIRVDSMLQRLLKLSKLLSNKGLPLIATSDEKALSHVFRANKVARKKRT